MEFPLKMRHFYLIVGLLCSLLSPQVAAELKIGYVNAIKVMDKAPQVTKANQRLKDEFAPREQTLVSTRQKIRNMEERLVKNRAIMSGSAVRRLEREIREEKRGFLRQQEVFQEDYNQRRKEELDKIQKIISKVIQDLVRRESYDLILSEGVIWASESVDVTDKVLRRLRQEDRRSRRRRW
jgi:outer membrane protein